MRLEKRAMKFIRSAACGERDVSVTRVTRIAADGFDAELLHGIQPRLDTVDAPTEAVDHRNAIHGNFERADLQPVDPRIRTAFDSRRQIEEVADIAPVER